jgi:hypothetical protein
MSRGAPSSTRDAKFGKPGVIEGAELRNDNSSCRRPSVFTLEGNKASGWLGGDEDDITRPWPFDLSRNVMAHGLLSSIVMLLQEKVTKVC